jgi:hypothetical protein
MGDSKECRVLSLMTEKRQFHIMSLARKCYYINFLAHYDYDYDYDYNYNSNSNFNFNFNSNSHLNCNSDYTDCSANSRA